MVIEKGKQIAKTMNITEEQLSFSNGWLRSFKERNKLKVTVNLGSQDL
jgi:hypothetical protein